MRLSAPVVISLLLTLSGCASRQTAYSGRKAFAIGSSEAILAHLTQRDASGELCDARLNGDRLADASLQDRIIDAWLAGRVSHRAFTRCFRLSFETLESTVAQSLLDELANVYERLLSNGDLESDERARAQLQTLHVLLLDRPSGLDATWATLAPRLERLAGLVESLGPVRRQFATEVLEAEALARGTWNGAPVDTRTLDGLLTAARETVLLRAALRLPDKSLRDEAARRLVRLRMRASPIPSVANGSPALEERVVLFRANPVVLHGPERVVVTEVTLKRDARWPTAITVTQPRGASFHSLAAMGGILPTLDLKGVAWVRVEGVSHPLTVCDDERPFDPTPCVPATALDIPSPLMGPLGHGRFDFMDEVPVELSYRLASTHAAQLPLHLEGQAIAVLPWSMRYLPGSSIEHEASKPASKGPAVTVRVRELLEGARFAFEVESGPVFDRRIVEVADLGRFRIASMGSRGYSGDDGADGHAGSDGDRCQNGGDGTDGGSGGSGGPGGPGGDVTVLVTCLQGRCSSETLAKLKAAVVSVGGEGGSGGRGGAGGRGGSGGASRPQQTGVDAQGQTFVVDRGCSAGSDGARGRDGTAGPDGTPGQPGVVSFTLANEPAL